MRGRRIIAAAGAAIIVAALPSPLGALVRRSAASGWTVTPSTQPTAGAGSLHAVACNTGACVAVGAIATITFAETRSGNGWVIAATPVLAGQSSALAGVACPRANGCVAVGTRVVDGTHASTLIENWDGTRRRVAPSANGRGRYNELFGVWCGAPTNCLAVGDSDGVTLIEHWNGEAWRVQPSPNPTRRSSDNQLQAVTCWAPDGCFATGSEIMDGFDDSVTLAERWNGTRWSIVNTPSPSDGNYAELASISCTGARNCVAAGDANYRPIIEQWDGTRWGIALHPTSFGQFHGVACTTASQCEVVGETQSGVVAESWNGRSWTSPMLSAPGGRDAYAVTCASGANCHTVGVSDFGPLTADWDGTAWTATTTARGVITPPNSLAAVSCPSASSCFAVGSTSAQTGWTHAEVTHWDGHVGRLILPPRQPASCRTCRVRRRRRAWPSACWPSSKAPRQSACSGTARAGPSIPWRCRRTRRSDRRSTACRARRRSTAWLSGPSCHQHRTAPRRRWPSTGTACIGRWCRRRSRDRMPRSKQCRARPRGRALPSARTTAQCSWNGGTARTGRSRTRRAASGVATT